MSDPVAGLTEMARVVRRDGVVAACVWDHAGQHGPLSLFWQAAREIDPDAEDESNLAGVREGELAALFDAAGLREIESSVLDASLEHETFDDWWEPFTGGVGPAGSFVARPRPGSAGGVARTMPGPATAGAVHDPSPRLGGARPRVTGAASARGA